MAKPMISAKGLKEADPVYVAAKAKGKAASDAAKGLKQAKVDFSDKTFSSLTGPEKDDLLKALAISAGIIAE
jgi:hypothetical protein